MEIINHECYVSLEVAKLLKEAGFDWEVKQWYEVLENGQELYAEGMTYNMNCGLYGESVYSMPTLEVAQKWLREVKNNDILISICVHAFEDVNEKAYIYTCIDDNTEEAKEYFEDTYYHTYEEALKAGIKKCLEIILEKK